VIPESFHFLRPAWLLALAPVALVAWAAVRGARQGSAWRRAVDAHLLRHLVESDAGATRRWPFALATIAAAAACVALAGPTWQRLPQPAFSSVAPTVVVLDMSPSMQADDLAPSRLGRARLEMHDLLERTRGGQLGLVLYTDEPFVAAPLTDDARLIAEMIPTLESGLMPLRAARPERAIAQAQALLDQAGAASGRVLLITDGLGEHADAALAAARTLAASGRTLSVLGAGTEAGAPARDARGRVANGPDGKPVTSRLESAALRELASAGGGRFSEIRPDDTDLATVAPAAPAGSMKAASPGSTAQFDTWHDVGPSLVLIPLLAAPLFFRRGLVAALALSVLAVSPARAEASTWGDLWSRRDQQAEAALAAGDAASAAQLFEDPAWKAAATYQSGAYDASVASYAGLEGDENRYNLGNALARSGKLEEAVATYDEVLASAPAHADAKFNRDLVQKLLDEQRRQQEQQQQEQKDQQQSGAQGNQDSQGGGDEQQDDQQNAGAGEQQSPAQQGGGSGDQAKADPSGEQPQGDAAENPSDEQKSAGAEHGADADQKPEQAAANAAHREQPEQDGESAAQAAASADDDAPTPNAQQQAQASARPENGADEANEAARDDASHEQDQASAQAAAERNAEAQKDRPLEQGLDQALANEANGEAVEQAQDDAPRGHGSGTPPPMTEQEQAREQALRNIPDDPGGLLRAKIRRQYAEKRYAQKEVSPSW